jgi:hypothetical protein
MVSGENDDYHLLVGRRQVLLCSVPSEHYILDECCNKTKHRGRLTYLIQNTTMAAVVIDARSGPRIYRKVVRAFYGKNCEWLLR